MIRWSVVIDDWGFPIFDGVNPRQIIPAAQVETVQEQGEAEIPVFPDTPQGRHDEYLWERDRPDRQEIEIHERDLDWAYDDSGYRDPYDWDMGGGYNDETLPSMETWYPVGY